MFTFKKGMENPYKTELWKQLEILRDMVADVDPEGYRAQLERCEALETQYLRWEESQRRGSVSKDTKVAASISILAMVAPYLIEAGGKLAPHLARAKGVSTPNMWGKHASAEDITKMFSGQK